ncbi:MAG: family 1 glycosylhydrolase [Cellulomonadaceae bacterium]|jgi:beta-glucosidase|nr:family 1 glycosylhydrolase [Cellulomonadaceae bacterium]
MDLSRHLTPSARLAAPMTAVPYVPGTPLAPTGNATGAVQMPADFLFGTATAAQQIEGAAHEGGREDSIWDAFCRVPGAVVHGDTVDVACDHYHRMPQDVALMKSLNLDTYRFSTSWARVQPGGRAVNAEGLAFYDRLVDELLEADILPWVTLYHWDLPQALEERLGGWANRDVAYRFAEYAQIVHSALSDRVKAWTTLNEPWCASYLSYIGGEHAPGRMDRAAGVAAGHHLLLGHGLAVDAMKAADPNSVVGLTLNMTHADAADPTNADDIAMAVKHDGMFNRAFIDPVIRGVYADDVRGWLGDDLTAVEQDGDLDIISTPIDVLGINYYNGSCIGATEQTVPEGAVVIKNSAEGVRDTDAGPLRETQPPTPAPQGIYHYSRGLPTTAMGWEVQPEGLTRLLDRVHRDYTGPRGIALYVTENGAAYDETPDADGFVDDSDTRLAYIDAHLRAIKDAIDLGVDVRGYFAWSLMDNFEWAHGYSKRFGLVRTNYETQDRSPKASALWYADVAKTRTVPAR